MDAPWGMRIILLTFFSLLLSYPLLSATSIPRSFELWGQLLTNYANGSNTCLPVIKNFISYCKLLCIRVELMRTTAFSPIKNHCQPVSSQNDFDAIRLCRFKSQPQMQCSCWILYGLWMDDDAIWYDCCARNCRETSGLMNWNQNWMGSSGIWTRDLSHPKRESYP